MNNYKYLPIERFDAEEWLQENKDIWNHPIISDRTEKNSYEVADLMAEFTMHVIKLLYIGDVRNCKWCGKEEVGFGIHGELCRDCDHKMRLGAME